MIANRNELKFYLFADMMMNRGRFSNTIVQKMQHIFVPDYIMKYLYHLRIHEYYRVRRGFIDKILSFVSGIKMQKLSVKLGITIASGVFGYGLVIPHYGTIVVGSGNKIGNYCVLHTSTCVTAGKKVIGDALYLSTGAKVINDIKLQDGISVGANAIVNSNFVESNVLIVGAPAQIKKTSKPWYLRDGKEFERRFIECEKLRISYGIK